VTGFWNNLQQVCSVLVKVLKLPLYKYQGIFWVIFFGEGREGRGMEILTKVKSHA
jgi:hypothetical protein